MSEAQTVADVGTVRDLTAFQRNILIILSEEPMYGLAIKRELESYYDDEVNHGRLYPNLDELVELGLVEKSELDKRTNQYELTSDGEDAIFEQLEWSLSKLGATDGRGAKLRTIVDESA
jgi:DNA-binding PadR family transcriptional regulator